MLKVITHTNRDEIDMKEVLFNLSDYFVFYFSNNNGYPVFLTRRNGKRYNMNENWGWSPALANSGSHYCFKGADANAALEAASKQRTIYAVPKNKWTEIFKQNPELCKY